MMCICLMGHQITRSCKGCLEVAVAMGTFRKISSGAALARLPELLTLSRRSQMRFNIEHTTLDAGMDMPQAAVMFRSPRFSRHVCVEMHAVNAIFDAHCFAM